jgi:anti-sigma regulatory factor (Ser/Thr protein kinase)
MKEGYSTAPEEIRALGFGAGMGLPNMKKNTDEMRIESTSGVGTTIYMTVRLG